MPRQATWEQDLERIIEASKGGAAIAAVSGGFNAAGNFATNTINNNQIKSNQPIQEQKPTGKIKIADIIKQNQDVLKEIPTQGQAINQKPKLDSTKLPTFKENKQVEQTLNNNTNIAQNLNKGFTEENKQNEVQNIQNVAEINTSQNKFNIPEGLSYDEYQNLIDDEDNKIIAKYGEKKWLDNISGMANDIPREELAYSEALLEARDNKGKVDDSQAVESIIVQLDKVEEKIFRVDCKRRSCKKRITKK